MNLGHNSRKQTKLSCNKQIPCSKCIKLNKVCLYSTPPTTSTTTNPNQQKEIIQNYSESLNLKLGNLGSAFLFNGGNNVKTGKIDNLIWEEVVIQHEG